MAKTVRIKAAKVPKSKKKVQFKVAIKGELNITSFIACQRVDQRLFLQVGNLLQSGDPDLDEKEFPVTINAFMSAWSALGNIAITIERRASK